MEHLVNLKEQHRLDLDEAYARKHAAEKEPEREGDAKRAREVEERRRTNAQGQEARSDAHLNTDPMHPLTQAFSGTTMDQQLRRIGQQPSNKARLELLSRAISVQLWMGCLGQGRIDSRRCRYFRPTRLHSLDRRTLWMR